MRLKTILAALLVGTGLMAAAPAQASFFFDENYPDVRWKSFETEHFIFHYYEKTSKSHPGSTAFTARRAAKYAEIMYPKVCEQFNYFLKEKVHVVVRDQEEYSNGFAVYSEDWVTIWATPLYYRLRGRMDWIPDVMTHEFSHIVSLKANEHRGVAMSLVDLASAVQYDGRNRAAYGMEFPFGSSNEAPFWWTEGGAEFYTHNVGYNHWGTSRDMLLRMSMLDPDTTLTLDQLGVRGDKTGLDGERGYNHGYSIGLYLAEKYGQETYAKFAKESQSGTHFEWEDVIKKVLGITPDQMWAGWVQWARDKYGRVKDDLEKQGVHEGTFVAWTEPQWVSKDEKKQKAWREATQNYRRFKHEKLGVYRYYPHVSPQGDVYGWTDARGGRLTLEFEDPDTLPAITGKWLNPETVPGAAAPVEPKSQETLPPHPDAPGGGGLSDAERLDRIPKLVLLGLEDSDWSFSPDGKHIVVSSARFKGNECLGYYHWADYQWNDLVVVDLSRAIQARAQAVKDGKKKEIEWGCSDQARDAKRITKEFRASQPNWSPDGEWISFLKYNDGTYNVWKIKPDGKELTQLTKFEDGTQIGEPRWSPDSKKLVFYMFRNTNDQQDIWEMNADGTGLHPLTWDKAEDKDAVYTPDGKAILFASDRSGIFNIYRMDLATHHLTQLTNVLGGAFSPALTKDGNLLYVGFNAYGFQNYALKKADFYEQKVDYQYKIPSDAKVKEELATTEELPPIPSPQRRYSSIRELEPPVIIPIARDLSFTAVPSVQAGGELIWWDYAGKNALIADVLLGENSDYIFRYFNDMWLPTFGLIWGRFQRSQALSFEYSLNPTPQYGEVTLLNQVDIYDAIMQWKVGPHHRIGADVEFLSFDVSTSGSDRHLQTDLPWQYGQHGVLSNVRAGVDLQYFTFDPQNLRGTLDVNPRGGHLIDLSVDHGWSSMTTSRNPGGLIQDGNRLTSYSFNKVQLSYANFWAVPWLEQLEHTLQFSLEAGWIDQDVQYNDEFFAGALHPYDSFNRINVNTEFAGYPAFSITGETMLIAQLAYRFPLYRNFDKKLGPVYFNSMYLQFFGSAGNIWSFRPNPDSNGQITNSVTGNNRELPFAGLFNSSSVNTLENGYSTIANPVGGQYGSANPGILEKAFPVAWKDGQRLLTEVGAELRLRNYIYNYSNWFSFLRVAYGFQDIVGVGDINQTGVYQQLPPSGFPESAVAPHGFRYMIGIGTGW